MSWFPSGLPPVVVALARSIEQRFQPRNPDGPVKVPGYPQAELPVPTDYAVAINTTTGKLVRAGLNAARDGFEWRNADGSAL